MRVRDRCASRVGLGDGERATQVRQRGSWERRCSTSGNSVRSSKRSVRGQQLADSARRAARRVARHVTRPRPGSPGAPPAPARVASAQLGVLVGQRRQRQPFLDREVLLPLPPPELQEMPDRPHERLSGRASEAQGSLERLGDGRAMSAASSGDRFDAERGLSG